MKNTNEVTKYLVLTQVASDAGKGVDNTLYEAAINTVDFKDDLSKALEKGYKIKNKYLLKALYYVVDSDYTYYVIKEPDQNGFDSALVLFELDGRQVSFHVPGRNPIAKYLYTLTDSTNDNFTPIEWNGIIGGSRRNLIELVQNIAA